MKNYGNLLLRTTIVFALLTIISIHPLGPVRGASNTPVYVLGVLNPFDPLILDLQSLTSSVTILPSVASVATLGPSSILYIDGSWLSTVSSIDPSILPTIVQTVLTGLPTIVVRGDPSILPNSISGLMKYENPGLPLIAEGVQVTGTLANGLREGALLRVISGFDYSVSAEFQWATQQIAHATSQPILSPLAITKQQISQAIVQTAPPPFWQLILQASTDTNDHFAPFGQVTTTFSIYELQNSNSTSSKWFDIFTNQTATPGATAFPHSSYRNYLETTSAHPNNQTTNIFVNNGPASQVSSGPTTVTYSIGTIAGSFNDTVTATQTMSYALKSANVTNTSSYPGVGWTQTINGGTSAGKLTLQYIPGWTDEVAINSHININGDLVTTFATFSNSITPTNTQSTDVPFQIFGG